MSACLLLLLLPDLAAADSDTGALYALPAALIVEALVQARLYADPLGLWLDLPQAAPPRRPHQWPAQRPMSVFPPGPSREPVFGR